MRSLRGGQILKISWSFFVTGFLHPVPASLQIWETVKIHAPHLGEGLTISGRNV